jgi:stearoyl-CoA desaturase (delta-9 desaturase)
LCWPTIAGLSALHVGAIAGVVWIIVHPSLATVIAAVIGYYTSGIAVTAGYHRLFAHRAYRAAPPLRWALLIVASSTFQNSAVSWSADHRAHHAETDDDGDPHAITRGVWYAHVAWLFRRRDASADVTQLTDLWALPSIRWQHRWYLPLAIVTGLVVPMGIATWWGDPIGGLLVLGFLRATVLLQATFCVNSLAHLVGSRRYDARSSARDSMITAIVTFGEGYHNFHHRFPYDYRNGSRWWQFDPSKWVIWSVGRVRLANTMRRASPATVAAARQRAREIASSPTLV